MTDAPCRSAAGAALLAGLLLASSWPAAAGETDAGDSAGRFDFGGDLRYRNETITQQYQGRRNRDRLRVRAGVTARVNEMVRAELGLATSEGNDPRSSNVTLGRTGSRKDLYIDFAAVRWQVLPSLELVAGKMKYPWHRAGESVLFDGDINPEGLAARWEQGNFFGSVFHHFIAERSDAAESTMRGAQFGWQVSAGRGELLLAAGYFDFHRVRGHDPFHEAANGNSITGLGCAGGASFCLTQDYDLAEGLVEFTQPLAGHPLAFFADYFTNAAADNGFDTAYSAGLRYGRVDAPRSWEIGYSFQRVEKDALFGQFIDSDVGAGNTDHRAHMLQAGYVVARNVVANITWQIADTDLDLPAVVGGVPVRSRNYERVQLDLNFSF